MKKEIKTNPQKDEIKKIDYPVFFNYIKIINYELTEDWNSQKNSSKHLKSARLYKTIIKI